MKEVVGLALLAFACQSHGANPSSSKKPTSVQTDVTAEDFVMPALPKGTVVLEDKLGGRHRVDVEVAHTLSARTRGMMWRTRLTDEQGMLFIFRGDRRLSFWMKNTLIPLDMIFIAADMKIVGFVERAEPKTLSPRGAEFPAMYVLEVRSGYVTDHALKTGTKVEMDVPAKLNIEPG
jgi:uncharacterized membrane protein (UPF0127 family)